MNPKLLKTFPAKFIGSRKTVIFMISEVRFTLRKMMLNVSLLRILYENIKEFFSTNKKLFLIILTSCV